MRLKQRRRKLLADLKRAFDASIKHQEEALDLINTWPELHDGCPLSAHSDLVNYLFDEIQDKLVLLEDLLND